MSTYFLTKNKLTIVVLFSYDFLLTTALVEANFILSHFESDLYIEYLKLCQEMAIKLNKSDL